MKPKSRIHHIPLALIGRPLLLLSPAAYAQDKDKDKKATEVEESKETPKEKDKTKKAVEVEKPEETPKEKTKDKKERAVEESDETAEDKGKARRDQETARRNEQATKRAEQADARKKKKAKQDKKTTEKKDPTPDPLQEDKNTPNPRKEGKPGLTPDKSVEKEIVEIEKIVISEPERLAETKVTEATREVQRDIDQRKAKIEGKEDAKKMIDEIIGAESRISRAEIDRQERYRPRFERQRPGEERLPEASDDQRRAATTYFQERLNGREVEGPQPEFFRRFDQRRDRRSPQVVERIEYVRPRYLNEGRRYVHFDSRAAIPAILMAAHAMNQVRFQPTREIAPIFYEQQDESVTHVTPLPPENYRTDNSWVVSYPVDEKSMISSEDILFLQGSTQFADPYSYEVIAVMADAMKAMPVEERFVIEGHASAEGTYENNMILSQQRAEHIVREIVRQGVSPYRLLPVGYGESEARNQDNAAEALRSQDRRVVVFRMKPETIAQREP